MRLIDADELRKQFEDRSLEDFTHLHFIDAIDNAPTIEPETKLVANVTFNKEEVEELVEKAKADVLAQIERPQGEWIKVQGEWITDMTYKICFKCSECDGHFGYPFNFCPNCGARMQKGGAE